MSLASGTRLGSYEIQAAIGTGGMGEVYRARDPRLARDVAIKVLPAAFSTDADRLQRFEQEARAAAALNHPNILAVHDFGPHRTGALHRVGAARRETLRERLAAAASPLPGSQGGRLRRPDRARARGRARERDRPSRSETGEPVRHHGRARQDSRLRTRQADGDRCGARVGERLPTAPAATAAGRACSARSATCRPNRCAADRPTIARDIFAFGAMLYEMLAGRRAFRGETTADTMTAILKEDPPDLPPADATFRRRSARIVDRCLEKNPGALPVGERFLDLPSTHCRHNRARRTRSLA